MPLTTARTASSRRPVAPPARQPDDRTPPRPFIARFEAEKLDMNATPDANAPVGAKGQRVLGEARAHVGAQLKIRYESGESIRGLASSTRRSYGFVYNVLVEAGAQLRPRGGHHPRPTFDKDQAGAEQAAD